MGLNKNCPWWDDPRCENKRPYGCPDGCPLYHKHLSNCAEKPPLGLKPRREHERERLLEILAAMTRYVEADKAVPLEWRAEMYELLQRYEKEGAQNGAG